MTSEQTQVKVDAKAAQEKEDSAGEKKGNIKFDLCIALQTLNNDKPELIERLEQDEAKVRALRAKIVDGARKNHILERELSELDEKIKLLIKNRMTLAEVLGNEKKEGEADEKEKEGAGISEKRQLYEDLFYLLQTKPKYVAKLARKIDAKYTVTFVQTVVFDLYGDQYDSREERLLLQVFRQMLQDELAEADDTGSLLRANTAVTQMLTSYAKRGQGLSVLKNILEQPIQAICGERKLDLEINPTAVYTQMIQDYETSTGQTHHLPPKVDDDTAAANADVQKIVTERVALLLKHTDIILNRILAAGDTIPYGMRWICKSLGELAKERFASIDRKEIVSLQGGIIYLRFLNPAIVTPEVNNLVKDKPSKIARRNLILIAKILQNLSNGIQFGDKEKYMRCCNEYIASRLEPLQKFFHNLVKVDDLDETLQVDKFLEHTSVRGNVLQISLSQIFQMHALVKEYIDFVSPSDEGDGFRQIVSALGPATKVPSKENDRTVALTLGNKTSSVTTSADAFVGPKVNPLELKAKKALTTVLRRLPQATAQSHIMPYLAEQRQLALDKKDAALAESIKMTIEMTKLLNSMNLLPKEGSEDDTYDNLVWSYVQEAINRRGRIIATSKRLGLIQSATDTIENHHQYLLSRLELYKMYLDNARRGNSAASSSAVVQPKKAAPKVFRASHPELEEKGLIKQTSGTVPRAVLKKVFYEFTMVSPGKFKVELSLKKGVEINLLKKPIELNLEDLLAMQERGNDSMEIDLVVLNVNILIHLLNSKFMIHAR